MLQARTWAEVDLGALEHNLAHIRAAAGEGVGVMLVVKADAYGHGAVPVSWHLLQHGAEALGVGHCTVEGDWVTARAWLRGELSRPR